MRDKSNTRWLLCHSNCHLYVNGGKKKQLNLNLPVFPLFIQTKQWQSSKRCLPVDSPWCSVPFGSTNDRDTWVGGVWWASAPTNSNRPIVPPILVLDRLLSTDCTGTVLSGRDSKLVIVLSSVKMTKTTKKTITYTTKCFTFVPHLMVVIVILIRRFHCQILVPVGCGIGARLCIVTLLVDHGSGGRHISTCCTKKTKQTQKQKTYSCKWFTFTTYHWRHYLEESVRERTYTYTYTHTHTRVRTYTHKHTHVRLDLEREGSWVTRRDRSGCVCVTSFERRWGELA